MTEPRDIEKDKAMLDEFADYGPLTEPEEMASYYIAKYEAQQARISELEKERDKWEQAWQHVRNNKDKALTRIAELERQIEEEEDNRPRFRMDANGNLTRMVGDE